MNQISTALLLVITLFSQGSLSTDKVGDIERHLLKVAQVQVDTECPTCRVELEIMNPKTVEDIALPDSVLADHWRGQTNLILKIEGETRIVTANIRWIDQAVVAKKNIRQGSILNAKDLRVVDKDVTFLKVAHVQSPEQVAGMVARRVFGRGQVIDEGMLKKPLAIRYGQPIKIEIQSRSLKVQMQGRAKGAGAIGERIPVYIPSTRKKVSATIISSSLVRAL